MMMRLIWWAVYAASATLLLWVGFGHLPPACGAVAATLAYTLTALAVVGAGVGVLVTVYPSYAIESAAKDGPEKYADQVRADRHREILVKAAAREGVFDIAAWRRVVSGVLSVAVVVGIAATGRPAVATVYAVAAMFGMLCTAVLAEVSKRAPKELARLDRVLAERLVKPAEPTRPATVGRSSHLMDRFDDLERDARMIAATARRR